MTERKNDGTDDRATGPKHSFGDRCGDSACPPRVAGFVSVPRPTPGPSFEFAFLIAALLAVTALGVTGHIHDDTLNRLAETLAGYVFADVTVRTAKRVVRSKSQEKKKDTSAEETS